MDIDGNNLIQVRTDNSAKSQLQWLPDGRLIYISRNCVYVMDVDTLQPQQLMCFVSDESLEDFEVSPDGKLVAISVQRTLNILPFDPEILKDIDSRFSLLALRDNCFYNQYAFREVLWSKSGTQIAAHVVDTELVSSDQIFLLNVDIPDCETVGPVRVAKIPGTRIDFDSDSTKRIASYDWDGDHLFPLNDSIRNDGFGNLYLYNSQDRQGQKINPIGGECCYRDARWSPDKSHLFFVFQRSGTAEIEFYYIPFTEPGNGGPWTPIPDLDTLFSTPREKPQPGHNLGPVDVQAVAAPVHRARVTHAAQGLCRHGSLHRVEHARVAGAVDGGVRVPGEYPEEVDRGGAGSARADPSISMTGCGWKRG